MEIELSKKAKNSRYNKLQQLIQENEFFSEESIQFKEPQLY